MDRKQLMIGSLVITEINTFGKSADIQYSKPMRVSAIINENVVELSYGDNIKPIVGVISELHGIGIDERFLKHNGFVISDDGKKYRFYFMDTVISYSLEMHVFEIYSTKYADSLLSTRVKMVHEMQIYSRMFANIEFSHPDE